MMRILIFGCLISLLGCGESTSDTDVTSEPNCDADLNLQNCPDGSLLSPTHQSECETVIADGKNCTSSGIGCFETQPGCAYACAAVVGDLEVCVDGDTAGGSDGAGADGGDGTSDGSIDGSGEITPCQFAIQDWWECNPWPNCPDTGCSSDQICTLVDGPPYAVTCIDAGEVPQGGVCDHGNELFCSDGLCVDGECRLFCNDSTDCPNSACQPIGGGPLTHVTACGSAQVACEPLDPVATCDPGLVCYYQQNTGLSSCLDTKQEGKDGNTCDCVNCCSAGNACVVHNEQKICAPVCALDELDAAPQCGELCAGKTVKTLSGGYGACVAEEGGGGPDPEPIPCNVLNQDCEGPGQACYPTNDGDQCLQKGNLSKGTSCKNVNECSPGLTCVASKCKVICDPNDKLDPNCSEADGKKCPPLGGQSAGGYCDE